MYFFLETVLGVENLVGTYYNASVGWKFFGNSVAQRSRIFDSRPQSFIDITRSLPQGRITSFIFYAPPRPRSRERLRLQIWREVSSNDRVYNLRWSRTVDFDILQTNGRLFQLNLPSKSGFYINDEQHFIGFTHEGSYVPIAFDSVPTARVRRKLVDGSTYPTVGSDIAFVDELLQYEFSIGVEIDAEDRNQYLPYTPSSPGVIGYYFSN